MATITSSASRESRQGIAVAPPARTLDEQLIAILEAPMTPYQRTDEAFARKECELGALFMTLHGADARAMQFRLTACRPGDVLANKFARLSLERRARLLAVLFEVRRRHVKVAP
ncbi:MAG TPA: hypothetical protein VM513_29410 [Kofleriaceae bacterium]|jgi:hypothetical protein|nr:hypothetical protein [Kofleriaceae bacterium]